MTAMVVSRLRSAGLRGFSGSVGSNSLQVLRMDRATVSCRSWLRQAALYTAAYRAAGVVPEDCKHDVMIKVEQASTQASKASERCMCRGTIALRMTCKAIDHVYQIGIRSKPCVRKM